MSRNVARLGLSGVLLFFVGLLLGLAIPNFPNVVAALSAHLNAVQGGTFLVALGAIWSKISIGRRTAGLVSTALTIAFWGLEIGMVLNALRSPGGLGDYDVSLMFAANLVLATSAAVMIVGMGVLLFSIRVADAND